MMSELVASGKNQVARSVRCARDTAATTLQAWSIRLDSLDNEGDGDRDGGDSGYANVPTEWKSWSTIKEHYYGE